MTQAGEKWEAGQAVRLPSIPAVTRYGIYENLHDFQDGTTLSEHLQIATQQQHGAAGRLWLEQLANTPTSELHAAQNAFMATLPQLDGQARRVARRFAIVAAALELAANITGLPCGVGLAGVKQCFDDWFVIHGDGKHEDRQIVENYEDWFGLYSGNRFTKLDGAGNPTTPHGNDTVSNHAGYVVRIDDHYEYYMTNAVFKEICGNFDKSKVVGMLVLAQMLSKGKEKDGRKMKDIGNKRDRFYHFINTTRTTPAAESKSVND